MIGRVDQRGIDSRHLNVRALLTGRLLKRGESLVVRSELVDLADYERRYDDAIAQIKKSLEMDPTFVVSHWYLGLFYQLKGMEQEALREVEEAVRLSDGDPLYLAALGRVPAAFGRAAEAEATLARLDQMGSARYVSSYYVAAIPAALGHRDQAFARLDRAVEERSHGLALLLVDPGVDPLRSDPRFDDLLRRVGLPTKRSL